jgi:hypothetical protein
MSTAVSNAPGRIKSAWHAGVCGYSSLSPTGLVAIHTKSGGGDSSVAAGNFRNFADALTLTAAYRECHGFVTAVWYSREEANRVRSSLRTLTV